MDKRTMVTINGNGTASVPDKVMMRDFEIAELFGVMIPAIRSNVRAILKSEVVTIDTRHGGTVIGTTILPDYYGLDMIIALAFRIHSCNAGVFREWILRKVTARSGCSNIPLYISFNCNQPPN